MNTTRRTIGSMPSRRPSPAQTPPITASPRSRRSGGGVAAALMPVMLSVTVVLPVSLRSGDRTPAPPGEDADPQESHWDFKWSRTTAGGDRRSPIPHGMAREGPLAPLAGQAEREQDRADGAEQRRPQVAEAQVEHVDLVEQEQRAERADDEPGSERGGVEAIHAASLHAALASTPGLRSATWLPPKSKLRLKALSTCLPPSQSVKLDWLLTTCSSPMPTSPWITRRFTPASSTGLWRQSTSRPPLSRSSTRA